MSQRIWGSGVALAPEPVVSSFVFLAGDGLVEWKPGEVLPGWRDLSSVRVPKARALSKHIPASPFCWTTQSHVVVESGLELDLLRELDRRAEVSWLVTQPMRLVFSDGTSHVPDLLEIRDDGVRVWDVRPQRRHDESFHKVAARTEAGCAAAGWEYAVFDDGSPVRRSNIRWLSCYAVSEALWSLDAVLSAVGSGRAGTIGELMDLFDGQLEILSALWHLVWRGDVVADLDVALTDETSLAVRPE